MKTLSLLRHAKSEWTDHVKRDFDRPLNERGRRAACAMGAWLAGEGLKFDLVFASSAVRIRETMAGLAEGYGRPLGEQYDERLYLASAPALFEIIREASADAEHLLVVGHSPGIEDLLLDATKGHESKLRTQAAIKYPTAAYARIEFDVENWADVEKGDGRLISFVRPLDLDPSLGPDRYEGK